MMEKRSEKTEPSNDWEDFFNFSLPPAFEPNAMSAAERSVAGSSTTPVGLESSSTLPTTTTDTTTDTPTDGPTDAPTGNDDKKKTCRKRVSGFWKRFKAILVRPYQSEPRQEKPRRKRRYERPEKRPQDGQTNPE